MTDLNKVSGGSTAFHKCACQVLMWKSNGVTLEINKDLGDLGMVLVDAKGAPSKITMLKPSEPNKGLGYNMAMDANQMIEYESWTGKIEHMCIAAETSRLGYTEAKQMLEQRLLPQSKYGLRLSQFTQTQCQRMEGRV